MQWPRAYTPAKQALNSNQKKLTGACRAGRLRAEGVYSIRIGRYGGGVGKRFHCFHYMIIHVI